MKSPEELASYIKNRLKKGYPQGELENELLQAGYSEEQLRQAFLSGNPGAKNNKTGKESSSQPLWFLISIGLGITGISILSVSYFQYYRPVGFLLAGIGIAGIVIRLILNASNKK